jgi:Transposase DDE domain
MATSGRGSRIVGYNVQSAVDTKRHLIVTHEVTNVGSDRSRLSRMSEQARKAIGSEAILADRGYYSGEEIVACEQAGVTVYLPKPMTSGLNVEGRFGKQDFVYVAADDVYTGNPPCDSVSRPTLPRPPHPTPTSVTIAIRPS